MSDLNNLITNLDRYRYNPTAIIRSALNHAEAITFGEKPIIDPTQPFIQLLGMAAYMTATANHESISHLRKMYQSLAVNAEDIYMHLSDKDVVGVWSMPATGVFIMAFDYEEIKKRAIKEDTTHIRKLVIPRNTLIQVDGTPFTLQYPIEIRLLPHGGLQVVYLTDILSPLQTLATNQVNYVIQNYPGHDNSFLFIEVPIQQIHISPMVLTISASTGLSTRVRYTDKYCYARVWLSTGPTTWRELPVVYQDIVHDVNNMTAVIKVYEDTLLVEIPSLYIQNSLSGKTVRVDVYTTRGQLVMDMKQYTSGQYTLRWNDIQSDAHARYSAPLNVFSNYLVTSTHVVNGGHDGIDFETLRARIINNAHGLPELPITEHQLNTLVEQKGYRLTRYIDNITDRVYQVSKQLPVDTTTSLSTGANTTMRHVEYALEVIRAHPHVFANPHTTTLTPKLLYKDDGVDVRIVDQAEILYLQGLSPEALANRVNTHRYLHTPFYYVIDNGQSRYHTRCYHLDNPQITRKQFVAENDTTQLQTTLRDYFITKTDTGYVFTVRTSSSKEFLAIDPSRIAMQLSFIPENERYHAYLNGTFRNRVEDELVFDFIIDSPLDINDKHHLILTNFQMFDNALRQLPTTLDKTFDLIVYVKDWAPEGQEVTELDTQRATWLLPGQWVGVVKERFDLQFGVALDRLWSSSRAIPGLLQYVTYDTDMPLLWDKDQYALDEDGLIIMDDVDGSLVPRLLHAQGTPVLDGEGQPLYRWRAGDLKLVNGEPIVAKDRDLRYFVDTYFVEGGFRFVTEPKVAQYFKNIPTLVTQWLTDDVETFNQQLLERTQLYLYPRNNLGMIPVVINDNRRVYMEAEQTFRVTYYMTASQYENYDLRQQLNDIAWSVINNHLDKMHISISAIINEIHQLARDAMINVTVTGLGGDENYSAITLINSADKCVIRKRLTPLANGQISMTDDILVFFIRHTDV